MEQKFPFSSREQSPGAAGTGIFGRREEEGIFFFRPQKKAEIGANKANRGASRARNLYKLFLSSALELREGTGSSFSFPPRTCGQKNSLARLEKRPQKKKRKEKNPRKAPNLGVPGERSSLGLRRLGGERWERSSARWGRSSPGWKNAGKGGIWGFPTPGSCPWKRRSRPGQRHLTDLGFSRGFKGVRRLREGKKKCGVLGGKALK